jgi:hypothetical protein
VRSAEAIIKTHEVTVEEAPTNNKKNKRNKKS